MLGSPPAQFVPDLLEAQARRKPNSVAVVFEDRSLTYGELAGRSNQLARYLKNCGIGPDVLVGIFVHRSLEMMVGLLGVLKAGGAYVPLDPTFPSERLAYMVQDAKVEVLLTEDRLVRQLPAHQAQVIRLDTDWGMIGRQSKEGLNGESRPDHLAYVIYTSGSTGQPKGVQITHRAVVNFLESMRRQPGLGEEDVLVAVTTLSFDIAGLELYLPLVAGARVVVLSQEAGADANQLAAWLDKTKATVMQATPATWRLLLDNGWPGNKRLKILCGGESLPRPLANQLLERARSVWNLYGPTETTIWSTVHQVEALEGPVPIGLPIANTTVHILGLDLQPVLPGQAGELHIGGVGLARGYRNRPDLTAEKFIPDPFSGAPGARLYKTGDLARFLADGTLECLGRTDHQVKIRGHRVELGEIEAALVRHPAVREAVAVAHEQNGNKRIVSYVVPRPNRGLHVTELQGFLKEKLPAYMIPSAFVLLDRLPLTPNGKVNRQALPAPSQERPDLDKAFLAPRNREERQLSKIWESVLKLQSIGVRDNLFDLGVHSLDAARLFSVVEKTFGKKLPPGPLFQAPTIERLAELLRKQGKNQNSTCLVPVQPQGSKPPFFCVHGAAGTVFVFHELARHLGPDQPLYALQMHGLYGTDTPHTSVEEMAAHYAKEIRAVQPAGPYWLGGYCFGGIIAYEMAQQLRRQGEEIAGLVLFNAPSPVYSRRGTSLALRGESNPSGHVNRLAKLNLRGKKKKFTYLLKTAGNSLAWRWRQLRGQIRSLFHKTKMLRCKCNIMLGRPLPEKLREAFFLNTNLRAELNYVPQPYPGSLILISAQGHFSEPLLGWGQSVAGLIEAFEINVDDQEERALMKEPHIRLVAELLQKCLQPDGAGSELSLEALERTK
jgi:amino acid adenylation domain-containing protein